MPATRARSTTRTRDPAQQWLVLEPNRIEKQYWKDLWRYREPAALQADLHRCGLGADAPYAILVFSAMLPWQFFSSALSSCSDSLISNANLFT